MSFQLRLFLKNVITTEAAAAAYVQLQRVLIQVETCHFSFAGILDLPLKKTVAASNLRHLLRAGEHFMSQTLKHIKTPPNPEVFNGRDLEPTVRHADSGRLRQILDLMLSCWFSLCVGYCHCQELCPYLSGFNLSLAPPCARQYTPAGLWSLRRCARRTPRSRQEKTAPCRRKTLPQ